MTNSFFLTKWFFLAMRWVFQNIAFQDVFLTVLICTVVLKLITLASDIKSRKSTMAMSALQPEIQKIQKKYANDPRKAQMEQSKLMKERGVSMWGSCLPMLITLPLFIFFLNAFRDWGTEQMARAIVETHQTGSTELFASFKWLWVNNIWQADNGATPVVLSAQNFLANSNLQHLIYFQENPQALDVFKQLGFIVEDVKNIPQSVIDTYNQITQPMANLYPGHNNGWFILPLLAAGTNFLSSWIMQKGQPQSNNAAGSMKMMNYMFPVISFIVCLTSNAAFAIYWSISSLLTVLTNVLLNKRFPRTISATEEVRK